MSVFHKKGSEVWIDRDSEASSKVLPTGTYSIQAHPLMGFYLQKIDDYKHEGKVYGSTPTQVKRVINTFHDRKVNTGLLLQGEKGSGKTLLGKLISEQLLKEGISTLIVNTPYHGEGFNEFLSKIDTPCVVMFDEFEKVYDYGKQDALLTLFDGVAVGGKKLFILTMNSYFRATDFIKNRPGRFFYNIQYNGLEPEFIVEYCKDNLKNQDEIRGVLVFASTFQNFNFDILKALVEEMNRYDEPVVDAIKYLNATPLEQQARFKVVTVEFNREGFKTAEYDEYANGGQAFNIFQSPGWIELRAKETTADEKKKAGAAARRRKNMERLLGTGFSDSSDDNWAEFAWEPHDLKEVKEDKYTFENPQGKITLEKEIVKQGFTVERLLMQIPAL